MALLPDGKLRHYIENRNEDPLAAAFDMDETTSDDTIMLHDYAQGQYCMDKVKKMIKLLQRIKIKKKVFFIF